MPQFQRRSRSIRAPCSAPLAGLWRKPLSASFQVRRQDADLRGALGLSKQTIAVENTRGIGKKDLVLNDALPQVEVNPETYEVRADGELLTCEPAEVLPMAQRYFMF